MTDDTALQGTPVQAARAAACTIPTDAQSADGTGLGLELRVADAAKFRVRE